MEWCTTVQDVLPGSEFCVQSYFYTKSKKPKKNLQNTFKNLKNLKPKNFF